MMRLRMCICASFLLSAHHHSFHFTKGSIRLILCSFHSTPSIYLYNINYKYIRTFWFSCYLKFPRFDYISKIRILSPHIFITHTHISIESAIWYRTIEKSAQWFFRFARTFRVYVQHVPALVISVSQPNTNKN